MLKHVDGNKFKMNQNRYENVPNKKEVQIPDWLLKKEHYIPKSDKESFLDKSILSFMRIISKIKTQNLETVSIYQMNVTLKIIATLFLIITISWTQSFSFVIVLFVSLLVILCLMSGKQIAGILAVSTGIAFFTTLIMLPSFFMGKSYAGIFLIFKVFVTVTTAGILSHTTRWSDVTGSLKNLFVPDIFILVLDIALKYIVMLGDFILHMLYALKLRSVGVNKKKYVSLSGIAGTAFIKSKEMAEDMYQAMECRGFCGEYKRQKRSKFSLVDFVCVIFLIGTVVLFFYFERI